MYDRILLPSVENEVFWVSKDGDTLNFFNHIEQNPLQFSINKESALYTYITKGNSNIDYFSLPLANPTCLIIEGKRMIVFSRFLYGERPRVCFYNVE